MRHQSESFPVTDQDEDIYAENTCCAPGEHRPHANSDGTFCPGVS